jgi:Spy/CpxP family protein refolding chaperone
MRRFIVCLCAMALVWTPSLGAQGVPTPQPVGSVTGVVRMPDGSPAANVRVTATRAEAADAVTAMASLAQTDATGRYKLENVPPGRYYISAGRVDLPTYFPGTMNIGQGTVVSIASAATVTDIDFIIQNTSATVPPNRRGSPFGVNQNLQNLQQNLQRLLPGPIQAPPPAFPGQPAQVAPPSPPLPQYQVIPAPQRVRPVAPLAARDVLTNLNAGLNTLAGALQPGAAWWTNATLVRRLGLTGEQRQKIEGIFDQYRSKIVQNKADLEKEEAALANMLDSEPLDPAKTVSAEIDKVIKARGDMERTYSNMTLEMRQVLSRTQWSQLQTVAPSTFTPFIALPTR